MKVGSLFSGCGGLDLGLKNAGFTLEWANDFDKAACKVYRDNIGDILEEDILELDVNKLSQIDVLTGGFPCQPFSSAGNRKGTDDHRGNLFFETIRFIKKLKPKAIVFENVRGLTSIKNSTGNKLIDDIVAILENIDNEIGYNVSWRLVNAADYGVPQNRYRVIIVGIRNDLGFHYKFPAPKILHDNSKQLVKWVIKYRKSLKNQEHWELSPQAKHMASFIKEGGSWKDIPYEELAPRFKRIRDNMKFYRAPNFYRRFARHEINGTITASAQPENCGIIHPTELRRYNVREIARFQSFPDKFTFDLGRIEHAYKVIGNAVPVKLACELGESLLNQLNNDKTLSETKDTSFSKEPDSKDLILKKTA